MLDEVNRYGGSISAEHGIGQLKRDHFLHSKDPLELPLPIERIGLHGLGPGPVAGAVLRHPPLHLRPLRRRQPALQPVAPGRRARDWAATQGAAITDAVLDEVNRYGGSISAEHGIGQLKRDHFLHSKDPLELRLMREIKRLVDPAGIMNPGKLL